MHKYRVIDCPVGQDRLPLEGGVGRFHWARVLNDPPRAGAILAGGRPHLGFGLLSCPRSTRTYRVIFESIHGVDTGCPLTGSIGGPVATSGVALSGA